MRKFKNIFWVNSIAQYINKPIMFTFLFALVFVVTNLKTTNCQTISPYLVGTNVWMNPDGGVWQKTADCKMQSIRIGGADYDHNMPSNGTLAGWVGQIQSMGAQPVVQVSEYQSPAAAAGIVQYLNITLGKKIKYWCIGNEPWLQNGRPDPGPYAATIANYFKSIAAAMKAVDPTIKIFGPDECDYLDAMYDNLFGGANDITGLVPGKNYYYCDGLSWHRYPQDGGDPATAGFNDILVRIKKASAKCDYINQLRQRPANDPFMWGIGEYNENGGYLTHSFSNGQMFGEVLGACMKYGCTFATTWSMFESGGNRGGTDFSMIDGNGVPRASYRHMEFIAKNFSGQYADGTSSNTNIVCFGSYNNGKISVMVMNRGGAALDYTIRLDNTTLGGTRVKLNINANNGTQYDDNIGAYTTQVLIFEGITLTKWTYTKANFDAAQAPPAPTVIIISNDKAPVAILTSPENNLSVDVNTSITVSATATDVDGTVSKVDFYAGTTKIGTDASAPYSITWAPTTNGKFDITAVATDNEGVTGTSNVATVLVSPAIPGTIEAESYTDMFGIQVEACQDGGQDVGYFDAKDWLTYSLKVTKAGTYSVDCRVAGWNTGGNFDIQNAAGTVLTNVVVPNTVVGGNTYQSWATVAGAKTFTLPTGVQTLKIYANTGNFNINWIKFNLTSPVLTKIVVTPPVISIGQNDPVQFVAAGFDQFGAPFAFTAPVVWTTTGGTIDQTGKYIATAITVDKTKPFVISATSASVIGTATVIVNGPSVLSKIIVTPAAITVNQNASIQFYSIGFDQYLAPFPFTSPVVWSATGGTIDQTGKYVATDVTVDTTKPFVVSATSSSIVGTAIVTVNPIPVLTTITLTPSTATIFVGQTLQLTAVGKDQKGNVMPLTNPVWTSSCGNIIPGVYTGTAANTCEVCVTVGAVKGCATIIVKDAPVLTTIEVTPANATVFVGKTQQYVAIGKDQYGSEMPISPTWAVDGGGTITQTGLFTATTKGGPFTVSAWVAFSGYTGVRGETKVTIDQVTSQVIQAEDYSGMQGIQTEATTDVGGGKNVGWIDVGDWMTYSVNIPVAGKYSVNFRVAGWTGTGKIELQNAANTKLSGITVPNTGGNQFWTTVAGDATFNLPAGAQTLRIYAAGAPWNLNWFELKLLAPSVLTTIAVTPAPVALSVGATQQFTATGKDQYGNVMAFTPTWNATGGNISTSGLYTAGTALGTFSVSAQSGAVVSNAAAVTIINTPIPFKIQAESFAAQFGTQTEACTDLGGGQDVGYVDPNDWLDYPVTIPSSGVYTISFRLACALGTGSFQLKSGANVLASVTVPNTGGWQNWQTVNVTANLTAGAQTLRIAFTGTGCNINWWEYTQGLKSAEEFASENNQVNIYPNPASGMVTIEADNSEFNFVEIRSLTGAVVLVQPVTENQTDLNISALKGGLYLITVRGNSRTITQKLLIQ
jgi:hypothetical protein